MSIAFGALGILIGALFAMGLVPDSAMAEALGQPGTSLRSFNELNGIVGIIPSTLTVWGGYLMLRLKPLGRRLVMGIAIYWTLAYLVTAFLTTPIVLEQAQPETKLLSVSSWLFGSVMGVCYCMLLIYFLSRSHVRAAFLHTATEHDVAG